jgi:ribose 5-phosphate isomerase B
MNRIIAIAADHAGVDYKQALIEDLRQLGHEVRDLGTNSLESVDYPDFAAKVAEAVKTGQASCGRLICATGTGMSIAANRVPGIRAALCHDITTVRLARQHNDANVLCLGARILGLTTARDVLMAFLEVEFEGGRHQRRVDKLG